MPTRAVATEDGPVLWLPPGTIVGWPAVGGRPVGHVRAAERYRQAWGVMERPWAGDGIVIVGVPGRAHSIWLFWESGVFAGWYVNLEDRWRSTRLGFDTQDHELDIWVESSGSWRWKDEDHLELAVEAGVFSAEEAAAFRAEGERVLAEWPFPTGWEDWRADPSWPVPTAPADWATRDLESSSQ